MIESFAEARRLVPDLRMVVVAGPRIDPATLPAADGLEVRGYVPDLPRQLGGCDLAIVQGGLATTMELTAARRPFIYVPLEQHFEQNGHVRYRLERYRRRAPAGVRRRDAGRARARRSPRSSGVTSTTCRCRPTARRELRR